MMALLGRQRSEYARDGLLSPAERKRARHQGRTRGGLLGNFGANDVAEIVMGVLPGSGDVMAARDSGRYGRDMLESVRGGDYGKAGSDAIQSLVAAAGALPMVPYLAGLGTKAVKALPMDEASRMARADEMGFDVDAYHGTVTKHQFNSFGKKDARGNVMETYFAPEEHRDFANGFASADQGRIYPVKLKTRDFLDTRREADKRAFEKLLEENDLAFRFREKGGYAKKENAEPDLPGWGDPRIIEMVRDAGYPGMVIQERPWMHSYAVFDPSHIRSRFAAFDPAKRDSADMLAGLAPLALLGAGAYALPDGDAPPQGLLARDGR